MSANEPKSWPPIIQKFIDWLPGASGDYTRALLNEDTPWEEVGSAYLAWRAEEEAAARPTVAAPAATTMFVRLAVLAASGLLPPANSGLRVLVEQTDLTITCAAGDTPPTWVFTVWPQGEVGGHVVIGYSADFPDGDFIRLHNPNGPFTRREALAQSRLMAWLESQLAALAAVPTSTPLGNQPEPEEV